MRHFVSSVAFVAVLTVMIITTKAAGKDQPSSPASEGHDKAAVASKVITNSIGMKMVLVPAGEFMMGSPDSDQDADSAEKPQHRVRITKPFYLFMYPVTRGSTSG